MTKSTTNVRIEQTAAEWLVRLQEPDVTEADLIEWDAWLKADRRHRRAFDGLESVSAFIAREQSALVDIPLPSEDELRTDEYAGEQRIALLNDSSVGDERLTVQKSGVRWAMAATVLLAIGVAAWFAAESDWPSTPDSHLQVVETRKSEHRSVELDDGSRIELGAASSLSVNYSGERRTIVLEAGEALFEVAKDPDRPFVVVAGTGTITAVGTAFNVRRDVNRVVVTVTEGEVEVVQQAGATVRMPDDSITGETSAPVRQNLVVGERVEYNATGIARLDDVAPEAATEWQNGRLRYRAESLKHVIPDVDRYSAQTVIIGDAAVGELKFTGTVFQDNADEWLRGLEKVFPVEVVELDGDKLLLRLRETER